MTLHEQLAAERQRCFPVAAHAAAALGVTRETVRRIENGTLVPGEDLLLRMLQLYQVGDLQAKQLLALRAGKGAAPPLTEKGLSRLVGRITADVLDLLRTSKSLSATELHAGIERIVEGRVHAWRNETTKEG